MFQPPFFPGSAPVASRLFERLVSPLPRPLRIINVGGTSEFWEQHGWAGRDDIQITLVNLQAQPARFANIAPHVASATDLRMFPDRSFDIAHSNSVIEHLFRFEDQRRMANELRRVAHLLAADAKLLVPDRTPFSVRGLAVVAYPLARRHPAQADLRLARPDAGRCESHSAGDGNSATAEAGTSHCFPVGASFPNAF